MSKTDKHRELIDQYLNNSLSETEKAAFLKHLNNDTDLKEQVLYEKKILAALHASEKAKMKERLKAVAQKPSSNQFIPPVRWLLAAASVIILFCVSYFFYINSSSPENIFDEFYEPYPALSAQRGDQIDAHQPLVLYSQGKYKEAIDAFDDVSLSDNPLYYLYLGNCYLQISNADEAIQSFQKAREASDDSILKQHADWYEALAYLKFNKPEQANLVLQKIIADKGIYAEQAEKVYAELN